MASPGRVCSKRQHEIGELRFADRALYAAKRNGRDGYLVDDGPA